MRQTTRRSRSGHPSRRKPPSRVRYEAANPTVSCRVSRALYERLQAAKEAEGKSFADVLKIGLGILEVRAKEEGELMEDAFEEGYAVGCEDTEREYKVVYPCKVCRKPIEVTSTNEKEAIKQYMQEHGWGHAECIDKRR